MSDRADYEQCVVLYTQGMPPRRIMEVTGLTRQQVRVYIARARRNGRIIPHALTRTPCLKRYSLEAGIALGSIGGLGHEISGEQRKWLVDEAVRVGCTTVQEYLAELVRDVHAACAQPREQAGHKGNGTDRGADTG